MNEKIMEKLFGPELRRIKESKCPICAKEIGEFKDKLSQTEYSISGLCQSCQDATFEESE